MICNPKLIPRFNIDYKTSDFLLSISSLRTKPDISPIRELFSDVNISFTNSGRTSLFVILNALNLPEKAKIGVPLYSCPSVFEAIVHAGCIPIFIDIDPDNYTLSPEDLAKKIDELEAIIVIHTFGRPADLERIQKIVRNKPIIEDCAHALLSKYEGRLVGTIGTAGFFTFRTGKYISAGEGGMIVTKDPKLANKIKKEIEKLPTPSAYNEIKHSLITLIRSTLYHRPWFGLLSLPLGSKIDGKVDLMNKYSFNTMQIRNVDLHVISRKMRDFKEKVEKQRENSRYLTSCLSSSNIKLPIEKNENFYNYYLFPVQLENSVVRDNLSNFLLKNGFDTSKLFSKTPEIAKLSYGYKGDCINTEKISGRILTIPNYYTLQSKEMNRITETVKLCVSSE
ncbi:UDP-4-amino-4-deoxy-L-arabinose--oxoglutarate aminotransferase [anaerobic digester metagenome]